ncbi:MAG TPA: hypothetical protein VFH73_16645, partial [Polyangia bacterium]|nr:hypothetical protein [Polyangia bacterium]
MEIGFPFRLVPAATAARQRQPEESGCEPIFPRQTTYVGTMWLLWATLATAPNGVAPLTIDGAATCPTASEVALRFSAMMAPAWAPTVGAPLVQAPDDGDRARIEIIDDTIEIVLRRADGTLIGRRWLPAQGSCDERARVASIVLATWQSDVHPTFVRQVAAPHGPPPSPSSATDIVKSLPPVASASGQATWDLGFGISSSVAGGAFVPGARLGGAFLGANSIGAHLTLAGEGDRSTTAGSGQAVWSRFAAGAGPTYRRHLGAWAIDTDLTLLAALYRVHGEQYPVSYQGRGVDGGVSAGVRLIAPGRIWRAWLAIDVTRWLNPREV